MSRGPSHQPYRGSLGRTQTTTVHVTGPRGDLIAAQVFTTIDAVSDPELVQRLFIDDPARALNVVRVDSGDSIRVAVPVVYHDPSQSTMVLILGDSHRHRELEERIALLERMRADDSAIPPYAKNFTVVYGPAGLRALLDERAEVLADEARRADDSREVERRRAEVDGRVSELDKVRDTNERRARELERRALDLDNKDNQIEKARVELEKARAEIDRLRSEARRIMIAAAAAQASAQAAQQAATAAQAINEVAEKAEVTVISVAPTPPAARPTPPTANPFAQEGDETRPVPLEKLEEIEEHLARVSVLPEVVHESVDLSKPFQGSFADEEEAEEAAAESRPTRALLDEDAEALRPTRALLDAAAERASAQAIESSTNNVAAPISLDDSVTNGSPILPPGADPLTSQTRDLPEVQLDAWIEKASLRDTSSVTAEQHGARLALVAGEQLARSLGGVLDIRVLLYRTRHYPVVALVIGPPPALRVVSTTQLAIVPLDIGQEKARAFLQQLAKQFDLTVELVVRGRRTRRVKLTAPLSENVGYIIRAAEDHLRGLSAGGEDPPSFAAACELVLGAGYDLLGVDHSDTPEFRDDKLAQLETAQHLRRAIAMARRFARPMREDYLVCTRGFPLPRWRELRRHVLESAVAWGLWMGPELAQVAVSEGLARSRRDLVVRLDHGFDKLRRNTAAFDIDEEAADDNFKALAEEARALGVELAKRNTIPREAISSSEELSVVSGSIGGNHTPPAGVKRQSRPTASVEELIAQLDDRSRRVGAAIELCEKADARAAAPVIAAVAKMSRAEAVRVLGMSVKFGPAAAAPLTAGLRSSKGFLRHGCALALALLRTDDGIHAVIDLLINEPTEIWREVARAIGQVGPTGLMPLASAFGGLGGSIGDRLPQVAERVAWAMAHIAVRGGKAAVETMANGHSVMAPVARQALELHGSAARDHVRVRPGADGSQPGRDVTVNRAFSRRFFEALEQGLPEVAAAGLEALDASSPMEMLDEEDLVEDDDDEQLDESDLIQT